MASESKQSEISVGKQSDAEIGAKMNAVIAEGVGLKFLFFDRGRFYFYTALPCVIRRATWR